MDEKFMYSPILIPTLCRYEHLVRCLDSLKKNIWAKYTSVYIGLDYPSKQEHWDGYNKICEYLYKGDFQEFAGFHVIKREKNYGSFANTQSLIDEVLKVYDTFIFSDDDAEFSTNFLEYMNLCLRNYKEDNTVIAVTGYSYPVHWTVQEEGNNTFLSDFICPMWGTGFWRDKYLGLHEEIVTNKYLVQIFDDVIHDGRINKLTTARYISYINDNLSWKKTSLINFVTDVAVGVYCTFRGKYIVMPVISKVRNHGFDGTGEYCQNVLESTRKTIRASNYNYSKQIIDLEMNFLLNPDNSKNCKKNKKIMDEFDARPLKYRIKAVAKLWLYRVVGKDNYKKMKELKKKI